MFALYINLKPIPLVGACKKLVINERNGIRQRHILNMDAITYNCSN